MKKENFIFLLLLVIANNFLASQKDTTFLRKNIISANKLHFKNANSSLDISYFLDTELSQSKKYQLYAEAGLIHGKNNEVASFLEAAIEVYSRTIYACKSKNISPFTLAELYARLGNAQNLKGESEQGISSILKAKQIYKDQKSEFYIHWCDLLIGNCYRQQLLFEKALVKIEKSISKLEQFNSSIELIEAYCSYVDAINLKISKEKISENELQKCENYLFAATLAENKIDNKYCRALISKSEGELSKLNKNDLIAESSLNVAINLFAEIKHLGSEIETKNSLGKVYLSQAKYKEVIKLLTPVSIIASQNGCFVALHKSYSNMAAAYNALGDKRTASTYAARAFTFWKHIINNERKFEIDAQMANFEKKRLDIENKIKATDLKEKSRQQKILIVLVLVFIFLSLVILWFYRKIRKNKIILEKQNIQIEASNNKNELLLKEIHHRVKNNLQIISSLLELQTKKVNDQSTKDLMIEGQNRVKSMALIHKNLYQNNDLGSISFQDYLEELCSILYQIYALPNIKVEQIIEAKDIYFDIDTSIPLGLIVNELVSNAYKYAFTDNLNPSLEIRIQNIGAGTFELTVKDNGTGIDPTIDIEKCKSLGLRLVSRLTLQLDGEIFIQNKNGSIFTIKFKDTQTRKLID